jgi:multiple antibiotic resistance protein
MWQERLSEFVTLLLIVNPVGALPIFLALAGGLERSLQRKVAVHAVVTAFVVLVFFVFAGSFLLKQMGIPVRAFQIAGGMILFLVALEMVRSHDYATIAGRDAAPTALAIYPLAIPKLAGPGAMLTVVLLTDDDRFHLGEQIWTVAVLALVMAITLVLLLAAAPISRVIGTAGANVVGRVMGILLAALAVSIVLAALADWLGLPKL